MRISFTIPYAASLTTNRLKFYLLHYRTSKTTTLFSKFNLLQNLQRRTVTTLNTSPHTINRIPVPQNVLVNISCCCCSCCWYNDDADVFVVPYLICSLIVCFFVQNLLERCAAYFYFSYNFVLRFTKFHISKSLLVFS